MNEEGNRQVGDATAAGMTGMMTFLEDSLKHYCETGETLRSWPSFRQVILTRPRQVAWGGFIPYHEFGR